MRSFIILGAAFAIALYCLLIAYVTDHPARQRWIVGSWLGLASILLAGLILLIFGS